MAGILTRSQLVSEILDNVSKASTTPTRSGVTLETMAIRYLDRAHITIARKEDFLFNIRTASTTADQKDYAMPSDIKALYSLRLENGLSSIKLTVAMPWEFDRLVPKPNELTTGQPDWYVPYKSTNTFELFRIPDAAYTMRMRLSYWPAAMSSDAQTSDYSNMDDVLIAYATSFMYRWLQEYADAETWKAHADGLFEDASKAERDSLPDWATRPRGFSTAPPASIGEYYNDPFIFGDPSVRSIL